MNINEIKNSIAASVIIPPILPKRILSQDFDDFLFFDANLSSDYEFIEEIQRARKLAFREIGTDVVFLYASDLTTLAIVEGQSAWASGIEKSILAMEARNLHGGAIVADEQLSWIAVQSSPVDIGVLGVDFNKKGAREFFEHLNRSWFFSVSDAAAAIDTDLPLSKALGRSFLKELVANYRVSDATGGHGQNHEDL